MVIWVIYLAVGLVIGGMAGYYFGRLDDSGDRKSAVLKHSLDESEKNFRDYQQQVQKHFIKTGEMVNAMARTYHEVHTHLAESAKFLFDYPHPDNTQAGRILENLDANPASQLTPASGNTEIENSDAQTELPTSIAASNESSAAHDIPVTTVSAGRTVH